MKKPETERKWFYCPHCGAKNAIMNDASDCHGVFIKCTRGCGKEFELVIENGKQIMKT